MVPPSVMLPGSPLASPLTPPRTPREAAGASQSRGTSVSSVLSENKLPAQLHTPMLLAEAAHDPAMPLLCQLGTPRLGRIPLPETSKYFSPIYTPSAAEKTTKDF